MCAEPKDLPSVILHLTGSLLFARTQHTAQPLVGACSVLHSTSDCCPLLPSWPSYPSVGRPKTIPCVIWWVVIAAVKKSKADKKEILF